MNVDAFNNLPVKVKVASGFGVLMTIMIVVGIANFTQLMSIGEDIKLYSERVEVVDAANEVDRAFVDYRRVVGDVDQARGAADQAKAATKAERRVREAIAKTEERVTDEERRRDLEDIKAKFKKYVEFTTKSLALVDEKHAIEEKVLDKDSRILRADLEKLIYSAAQAGDSNGVIVANEALRELLQAEIYGNIALGRHDLSLKPKAEAKLKSFNAAIAKLDRYVTSPEERKLMNEIKLLTTEYYSGFEKAIALNKKVVAIKSEELSKLSGIISYDADHIRTTAVDEEVKYKKHALDLVASTEWTIAIASILGAVVGAALALFIGKTIANPIGEIAVVLRKIASGDKSVTVPYVERKDEVGQNALSAQVFKENLIQLERMEKDRQEEEARIKVRRKAEMQKLAEDFQAAVGGIVAAVGSASEKLKGSAHNMANHADTTQQLSSMVATASDQTSANVHGVATASEEMAATVSEIARQVQQSTSIADSAVAQAAQTNDRVQQLSQSAERIGNVIELINTIAGQTNLLALNATIEAARAGDAGKGFAVVAEEVKALAEQTSSATNEIASQIASMQSATDDAVGAIQEISGTINRIAEISGTIAAAVEQQGATTTEISRNVAEAAKGTAEVATSITEVSEGATGTGKEAQDVLASATHLSSESDALTSEVKRFLDMVRAA